jgi:hypothetical protein
VCRKFSRRPDLAWFPINEGRLEGNNVVPPGTRIRKSSQRISFLRIETFKSGIGPRNRFLYVWGVVRYKDGFGKPRFTKFCHRYNMNAEANLSIRRDDARHHEYGSNDAD